MTSTNPYHPDRVVDGLPVGFAHLEPTTLDCPVRNLGRTLRVHVRFSNHCFSETFVKGKHDPALIVEDRGAARAFDWLRYAASKALPVLVTSLPGGSVYMLPPGRNFATFVLQAGPFGYAMFFTLKRGGPADLELFVESAYPKAKTTLLQQIASATKVAFPVLCAKVFQGQDLRFHAKR